MRWGTLERVPQTPQNFSKTGLRLPGIGTDARFRDFSCSLPLPCRPDTRGRGHLLRRLSQCCFRLSPGDARGEAPCIRKLKIPPSQWEGGWGDGGRKASQKQGWQATRKARPSPGNGKARSASEAETSFKSPPAHPCPLRALSPQVQPMPLPAQPRGCKGRSPLYKKTKHSPFPPGRGAGGWGQQGKLKARSASKAENSFKSPPAHPRPKNAAGARQATGDRRRRTDPPSAEEKAGGREPRCTGHPEAPPRRDPPESG